MFAIRVDENLSLVLAEERHSAAAYDLIVRNAEHLKPWMAWVEKTNSVDDVVAFYRMCLERFAKAEGLCTLIFDRDEMIGSIGLVRVEKDKKLTEIGYWLDKSYCGKGIMTKCVRVFLSHLFGELKFNRVEIRADADNKPSRAIPERLGFANEGTLRDGSLLCGEKLGDLVVYGMLARDWKPG